MNRRTTGTEYEQKAAIFLEKEGYQILCRNYRCKVGEIDLIAKHGAYLVFVEVKYRATLKSGYGSEAVNLQKQRRIYKSALWYIKEKNFSADIPCRFDVIEFLGDEPRLIQDAFYI